MKKIKYQSKKSENEQGDFVNSEYWEKRVANHIWNSYNSLEEENYALLKHYEKLSDDIRLQLYSLTEQEKSGDLTRTQRYLKTHLQELQNGITKKCEELGGKVESEAIKNISEEIKNDYQNSFVSISEEKFHQLSTNQCKEIINNPWHGSYFSKRIWNNTTKLAEDLNQILSSGITEGKTIAEMAVQLANRTHQELNKAHRLIRTETINSLNRSALRGFKDAGVQFVRWWAAEDERTCEVCGANHGKVYQIEKAPNIPCHPGCRCTWLPVFEDELVEQDFEHLKKIPETTDKHFQKNTINDKINMKVDDLTDLTRPNDSINRIKKSEWDNDLEPRGQVNRDIYLKWSQDGHEEEIYGWVANELKISTEKAIEYVDAVMGYTDGQSDIYSELRRYQRGETLRFMEQNEVAEIGHSIEEYIKKSPRWNGGETFRGISISDEELSKYVNGFKLDMGGTSSWTNTKSVAENFSKINLTYERPNPIIYHCDTQNKGTGIRHISIYDSENEVLISNESKYIVDRVEIDDNFIHHIYLKEV